MGTPVWELRVGSRRYLPARRGKGMRVRQQVEGERWIRQQVKGGRWLRRRWRQDTGREMDGGTDYGSGVIARICGTELVKESIVKGERGRNRSDPMGQTYRDRARLPISPAEPASA